MTPAEKRIKDLLDRWLTSIELHLQYTDLSDEAYAEIQAWPKHDRPTRWVLEHAKQKANELKEAFESRQQMGDSKFADALELMSFLANLVGAQHVDRFIPIAEPPADVVMPKPVSRAGTAPAASDVPSWYAQAQAQTRAAAPKPVERPLPPQEKKPSPPIPPPSASPADVTRTMPRPIVKPRAPDVEPTREMPKLRPAQPKPDSRKPARTAAPMQPRAAAKTAESGEEQTVIVDAVRLMTWGRTWHELAELIARMADRPPIAEVRKILRAHRAAIEKSAKEAAKG